MKIYKEARMWADAQRIAREYCPQRCAALCSGYTALWSSGARGAWFAMILLNANSGIIAENQ